MNDSSSTTGFTQLAREGMNDYVSIGQPQQEDVEKLSWEATSSYASLSSRGSSFKLKKMNLLSNKNIHGKNSTAQKMKFSIKDLFSKYDQICRKLRIWSHLLKKSLMENFIFCAAFIASKINILQKI